MGTDVGLGKDVWIVVGAGARVGVTVEGGVATARVAKGGEVVGVDAAVGIGDEVARGARVSELAVGRGCSGFEAHASAVRKPARKSRRTKPSRLMAQSISITRAQMIKREFNRY